VVTPAVNTSLAKATALALDLAQRRLDDRSADIATALARLSTEVDEFDALLAEMEIDDMSHPLRYWFEEGVEGCRKGAWEVLDHAITASIRRQALGHIRYGDEDGEGLLTIDGIRILTILAQSLVEGELLEEREGVALIEFLSHLEDRQIIEEGDFSSHACLSGQARIGGWNIAMTAGHELEEVAYSSAGNCQNCGKDLSVIRISACCENPAMSGQEISCEFSS